MAPQVYPKQSTPLILDAGSKDSKPFQRLQRGAWYIRLGVSMPNLLGNPPSDGEVPLVSLKAGDGPLCQVSTSATSVVSDETGQVAQVTRATFGASIFSFKLNVTRVVEKWQLHIENTGSSKRMFTWVVADNEPDSKQPWIDVLGPAVDFGEVTDAKLGETKSFQVGNRGTGTLTVNGMDLPRGFQVVTTLPLDIVPGRSATIEIKPTSKPSVAIESTCTVQSNDSLTGHNNQITLKASPPPAPKLPTLDRFTPDQLEQGKSDTLTVYGSNLGAMKVIRFHRDNEAKASELVTAANVTVNYAEDEITATLNVAMTAPTDKPYYMWLLRSDDDHEPTKCDTPFWVTPAQPQDLLMKPDHGLLGTRKDYQLVGKNLGNVDQVSFEPTGNITATIKTKGPSEIVLNLEIKEDAFIGDYDLTLAPSGSKFLKAFRVDAATVYSIEPNWGTRGTTLPAFITVQGLSNVEGPIKFRQEGKTEDAPGISASTAHFGDEVPAIPVNAEVMKLAFGDEGRHLLVLLADVDGAGPAVRRYEFPQYKLLNQVRLDKEELQGCILSPTGSLFVTVRAGFPPLVQLWDVATGRNWNVLEKCMQSMDYGKGEVTRANVAFSPNGKYLAVGTIQDYVLNIGHDPFNRGFEGGNIGVYPQFDPHSGDMPAQPEPRGVALTKLTLFLVDIDTKEIEYVEPSEYVAVPSFNDKIAAILAFSPDSSRLAVSLRDKNWKASEPDFGSWHVELRDIPSLSQLGRPFSVEDTEMQRLAFSGPLLAARAGNSQWKIWEVATGVEVATMTDATDLVFSPNGAWLAVVRGPGSFPIVSIDWEVRVFHTRDRWDNTSISPSGSKSYPNDQPVTHMVFSRNGRYLLVNHGDSAEILEHEHWVEWPFPKAGFNEPAESPGTLNIALQIKNLQPGIAFSPDGRYLVAASSSGVRTWLVAETRFQYDDLGRLWHSFPVMIEIDANASPAKHTFRLRTSEGVGFDKDVTFTVERNA